MKGVLGLICMLAVTMAAASAASSSEWDLYKEKYGKVYEDPEVDRLRRLIYESSVQLIEWHNARHAKGLTSYTMAVNVFADQLESEFLGLLGFSMEIPTSSNVSVYQASVLAPPESVDWREVGYVTDVKDQGPCRSSWTFSATGAVEGQYCKKSGTGFVVPFSEQQILDCDSRTSSLDECPVGDPLQAFGYIQKAGGIETENDYPYVDQVGQCEFDIKKVVAKVTGSQLLPPGSEEVLQNAIAEIGPISVSIDARAMKHYQSGIFDGCSSEVVLNHSALAVGYGSQNGDEYYIVKNSFGPGWGEDGYIRMQRNQNNKCGIASHASFPTVGLFF